MIQRINQMNSTIIKLIALFVLVVSAIECVGEGKVTEKPKPLHFQDDFTREDVGSSWEVKGNWSLKKPPVIGVTPNPSSLFGQASKDQSARLITGQVTWSNFVFQASYQCEAAQAGLLFGMNGKENAPSYRILIEQSPGEAQLVLERIEGGASTILDSARTGLRTDQWHRIEVEVPDTESIKVRLDGKELLSYGGPLSRLGRVGLFVEKGEATFDDVSVVGRNHPLWQNRESALRPVSVHSPTYKDKERYTKDDRDDALFAWTRDEDAWTLLPTPRGRTFRGKMGFLNSTTLWGDFKIQIPSVPSGRTGDRLLVFNTTGMKRLLVLPLPSQNRYEVSRVNGSLRWRRSKGSLLWHKGTEEEQLKTKKELLDPSTGIRVGFYFSPSNIKSLGSLPTIYSRRVWHEFFETAPVDWQIVAGNWRNQNRWTCMKALNWFAGLDSNVPFIFSKHSYRGNQLHEFYCGMKDIFGRQFENRRYVRHDVNFSFLTDGRNLNSGYTFMYGGYGNRASYLLKGDRIVATNKKFKFRKFVDIDDLHVKWNRIRVECIGKQVRVWWNREIVFDYKDRNPLPRTGHIAFWTFKNGVVMGKVKSMAEGREARGDIYLENSPDEKTETPGPWTPLNMNEVRLTSLGDGRYQAVNRRGGGEFAVQYKLEEPVDLSETPVISIPFRPSSGTRVNLHLVVNGAPFILPITAPVVETYHVLGAPKAYEHAWGPYAEKSYPSDLFLGSPNWEETDSIRFDLGAALNGKLSSEEGLNLTSLILGNTSNHNYLLAGFSGNGEGTRFTVGKPRFTKK